MAIQTADELFNRLVSAQEVREVEVILKEIGDSSSVGLSEPFGPLRCAWSHTGLPTRTRRQLDSGLTQGEASPNASPTRWTLCSS